MYVQTNYESKVFIVHLLMDEMCEMPEKEYMHATMSKHLGEVDCFCHDGQVAGFAPKKYVVHFEKDNIDVPPQLMITNCTNIERYTCCITMCFFDEYNVTVTFFCLSVCELDHLLCFSASFWTCQ